MVVCFKLYVLFCSTIERTCFRLYVLFCSTIERTLTIILIKLHYRNRSVIQLF